MNNLYYNRKKLKQIKNKRTQKTKRVWGWILTAVGGLGLPGAISSVAAGASLTALVSPLVFLVPGIALLLLAKRQVDKWDRYEAIIDNRGNTPISLIAKRMKMSEQAVYVDLQNMIQSDFFIGPNYNIEAYIDAERDLLVMASGGQPLKPVPDPPSEEERQQRAQQTGFFRGRRGRKAAKTGQTAADASADSQGASDASAHSQGAFGASADEKTGRPDDGEAASDAEEIREVELTDLEQIQQAIADTPDDEVRGYLYGLEGSLRRIDERLEDEPELMQMLSIKRLYKYYLPQILELISKYQAPDTPADLKEQIREALRTSAGALANIEADLLEREQMDAEVDIEVLKNMFAQDGLLDRGGQDRPQPQPQPR